MVVARGVGLATMAPLLQQAARAGIVLTIVMSARTPEDLMRNAFLRGIDADVHCLYDSDGTSAMSALDKLLHDILGKHHHDMIYTCGSHRILRLLPVHPGGVPWILEARSRLNNAWRVEWAFVSLA
ncbi:hypothetical protein LNO89_30855 [Klebsiella pneumoniae subsp. pneumoniae]|nr:hypothetical protein [Klebsiella pneumoniae subsp. pneumoniae]